MKTNYCLLAMFVFLASFAQVKNVNRELEKKRISLEKLSIMSVDSAKKEAILLLRSVEDTKSKAGIAKVQSTLAYLAVFEAKTDEAKVLNRKSLKVNLALGDEKEIAKNYFIDAIVLARESDFVKSLGFFLKSIDLAKKTKSYLLIQKNYRGLANLYCDQRDYDAALKNALSALKYSHFENDPSETAYIYATIAEIYRLKGDLKNANHQFEKAYAGFLKIREEHGQAYVLTNWSLCYEDNYNRLLEMEFKAQEIWDRIAPENLMSVTNLGNLAYSFFDVAKNDSIAKTIKNPKLKKPKKELLRLAENYYQRCLSIAKKKKNLDSVLYYSSTLSELQGYIGDYRNAYESLKLAKDINDSLYSQKNKNTIAALVTEKEIQIRDKEIQISKINLRNKEKQKLYLIGGLLLLCIIGTLLFYQSRNRKKTNKKLKMLNTDLETANKTKTRFFSILNHDLRTPVSNLIHFLHLQKENPELLDEESRKRMEDKTISGVEHLLTSMEDLLLWSKGQMENFEPQLKQIKVDDLFNDIQKYFDSEQNVVLKFENEDDVELFSDGNYVKTIMRNLTGNAIKALKITDNPLVIWKAWQEKDQVFLSISDNGSGVEKEAFQALYDDKKVVGIKSGLGLHLIRDLAKAIKCEIAVTSGINGTVFTLKFP